MIKNSEQQKILVVDDSSENIELLYSMLQGEYQVLFSTSGSKALMLAESAKPALILLDIVMPEMDGYEVIKALKSNDKTEDIPVIFLTAKTSKKDLLKGFELGAIDYIGKPFFVEEIKHRINIHLHNRLLIKQLELANKKLEQLTLSDGLTEIGNRRYFDQFLSRALSNLQREQKPLSLLILDVDYFKKFNDLYGHIAGDQCLQSIANVLSSFSNRGGDLAARYGGEEFALILSDTAAEEAKQYANNCRSSIENLQILHTQSDVSDYVTVSIGLVTIIPPLMENQQVMIKHIINQADSALYQSKENGRNQVCVSLNSAILT